MIVTKLPAAALHPGRRLALVVLLAAAAMNLIDGTIVNVALPTIQNDFSASSTQLEWISAVYLLAFATGLLPFGRFGDVFGRRRIFALGVAGFTITSAFCGLSPNVETLVAARLAQGIFGAAMVPQVLALMRVIFPPEEQGWAFAKFTLVSSLASVSGPLIGGALVQADFLELGWRTIFFINLPIGLAILSGLALVPKVPQLGLMKIDKSGTAILAASIVAIVLPLIEGRAIGWPWWAFVSITGGLMLGTLFIVVELRKEQAGKAQLLPGSLIRSKEFLVGLLQVMLLFAVPSGLFLVFGIYLQAGLQLSALQAGLMISPFPAGVMIASLLTSRMSFDSRALRTAVGTGVMLGALIYLRIAIASGYLSSHAWQGAPPILLAGFGMGVAVVALYPKVLTTVPSGDAGAGAGALQTVQHIGLVIGIAVIGEVFFTSLGVGGAKAAAGEPAWSSAMENAATGALVIVATLLALLVWRLALRPTGPAITLERRDLAS
ncbi:MAG: MFS transporter [Pseudomonas sp.]